MEFREFSNPEGRNNKKVSEKLNSIQNGRSR